MKHFTSVHSTNPHELVELAAKIKQSPIAHSDLGRNKTMGLLFLNPSLRTRLSTQKAAQNLGLNTMVLNLNSDGWKVEFDDEVIMDGQAGEHIREAAQVIGQYCDIIGIRCFPELKNREKEYAEEVLNKFIEYSGCPVVSLESCTRHPLQSLADILTIEELKTKAKPKVVLSWAPHVKALPQSVPNSFVEWAKEFDYDLVITHPPEFALDPAFTAGVSILHNQDEALRDADFVYTKNWSGFENYGYYSEKLYKDWQITEEKMKQTNQGKFLHCLPIRRNVVASDQVLDGPHSEVIAQAKNREHAAQAVLQKLLEAQT